MKDSKTVRIEVNVPNTRQDVYNVIGTIYGKEEPDRWVLFGNHRDAWGFGAADPSSGTAVMMEISRGLKDLLKSGKILSVLPPSPPLFFPFCEQRSILHTHIIQSKYSTRSKRSKLRFRLASKTNNKVLQLGS